jgi:hypothetical protein
VAVLPPRNAPATVRSLAVCAVMAGCRPEYMPTLVAAIRALADPLYGLGAVNTSSSPAAPLLLLNGPVRDRVGLNYRWGHMGPGSQANASIGRAVSLAMINLAGRRPGTVSMATHAQPGQYTFCIGEFEEMSPWEPFHVEKGLAAGRSCVTVFAVTGTTGVIDIQSKLADGLLQTFASSITAIGSPNQLPYFGLGHMLLVLCPSHAEKLSSFGYSKRAVKEALFERTQRVPLERWPEETWPLLAATGRARDGFVPLLESPDQLEIVVAGGLGGLHTVFLPTAGYQLPIQRLIEEEE